MTKLLIDGDVLVYRAALSAEYEHRWEDGIWTLEAREDDAINFIEKTIDSITASLGSCDYVVALSCTKSNFRKDIYPDYKSNRKDHRKPLLYRFIRDYISTEHPTKVQEGLEGDDVIGILATKGKKKPNTVIVSIDKDFKSIPNKYWNMDSEEMVDTTPEEAHRFHMLQTLMGDTVDGYGGCKGVGPKTAEKVLNASEGCLWESVVKQYNKAGMTEEDALVQARLARILHASDYDFKKKEVKLWKPD